MKIVLSAKSSDHWMTVMTCTFCKDIPEHSPIYKCDQGHTICYSCFQELVTKKEIPSCTICESENFTRQEVSSDFVHKLKNKPGIGRPYRYFLYSDNHKTQSSLNTEPECITLEKIFQLPTATLQKLFDDTNKKKMFKPISKYNKLRRPNLIDEICNKEVKIENTLGCFDSAKLLSNKITNDDSRLILNAEYYSVPMTYSKEPLKCPHDACNKMLAVSSFKLHFKFDHNDLQRYQLEKGQELKIAFDPAIIQYNHSICLAIIELFENNDTRNSFRKGAVDTFWLMVSGSPDDRPRNSYSIFWLFTNTDQKYKCTQTVSSHQDKMICSTFCGVNSIHESQNISEITARMNCLFVAFGTLKSMLMYDPMMNLRITIY